MPSGKRFALKFSLGLLLILGGCEGGWHPLDCAMGKSYSPTWCSPGTKGYDNQLNGQGKSYDEVANKIMTGFAAGLEVGAATRNTGNYPFSDATAQATRDKIDGAFQGWTGKSVYKLMSGHVIQQSDFHFHFHYSYSPEVIVYRSEDGLKLHVQDVQDEDVSIRILP